MRGLQVRARGLYVMKLMVARKTLQEIQERTKKEYGCSQAAFWKYYRLAKEMYSEGIEVDRTVEVSKAVRDLEYLYERALQSDDIRTALAVLKELNTLKGLYTSQSMSVEVKTEEAVAKMKTILGGKE